MEDLKKKLMETVQNEEFVRWAARKEYKFSFIILEGKKYMEEPIESLELSVRSYNCLKRAGFTTINSLLKVITGREDLKKLRNLGTRSADEIMLKIFLYQYAHYDPSRREVYLQRVRSINQ